ncbi:MAG: hypothetical protein ACJAUD_001203 [Crocinitomicaceae bacterium]|jgi:hypothetical protein
MKTIFCTLALLFISANSISQQPGDTIIVQSFDWPMTALGNSGNRDMMVPFPDDSTLTYEKIIMKYNMRCRNGDVNTTGGNYVACGEWDYSCNTYIHDSTRIDSTANTTPSHQISGWTGTTFNYSSVPTNSYYRYLQQEVTLNTILTETQSSVGAGGTTLNQTFPSNTNNGKSQYLFTAAELSGAGVTIGDLSALSLNVLNAGGVTDYLRVRIKHTPKTALDDTDPDLTGFTEVYFYNTAFVNGPNRLQFYNAFNWDGASNIIVEFSFTNPQNATIIDIDGEDTGMNYGMFTQGDRNFVFNGENYIESDTYKGIDGSADRTSEAWIKTSVNNKEITSWGLNATSQKWVFRINDNGTVRVEVNGGAVYGTTLVDDDEWHHVACVFSGTDVADVLLYVDGQLETIASTLTEPVLTNTAAGINMRVSRGTNERYFDGIIDEVRVWSSALTQAEIQDWMYRTLDASHPSYANLEVYYPMNEGTGSAIADVTSNANDASVMSGEIWERPRGLELFKELILTTERPNFTFMQGTYNLTIVNDTIYDTVQNVGNYITEYGIISQAGTLNTDIISELSSNLVWEAAYNYVYDENGVLIQSIPVNPDGQVTPGILDYYNRYPMRYEIVSFVTPYGNGLDLGINGKTWNFDLTDFTPILKGNKRMTMERGGQWNESFDIQFWFIVGTPPRDVVDIEQIWRNDSKGYTSIVSDAAFEPRMKTFNANATSFKVRSAITGHGQEGEFISREHYINVNGGPIEFSWQVWKECAENAIFPQGGTWIYDRAGWCPGRPTDLQEFDITNFVTPGQSHELDYGMATASGTSNYIVNNQLVSYGGANFSTDASIIDIMNPSNYVEYERTNSICANPIIILKNTGSAMLTEAVIEYWVNNDPTPQTFTWTGSLPFLAETQVVLPTPSALWDALSTTNTFHAQITSVNAGTDEYAPNNHFETGFSIPEVTPSHFYVEFKTNSAGFESSWELLDDNGTVLGSRAGMSNNTTYKDTFNLGFGCYQLKILDSGDDGISFFANNDGVGFVRLREVGGGVVKTFQPNFGKSIIHNFTIDYPLAYEELNDIYAVEVYPNPTSDQFFVEAGSISEADIEIYNGMGQLMNLPMVAAIDKLTFDSSSLPTGIYLVKINYRGELQTKKIIVE